MLVAIHQPNYFPWLGFFYKIYVADAFVFHDVAQHSKRYPTRRTRIRAAKNSDAAAWLSVPLLRHSDFSPIKDLEIDHRQNWAEKHLQKMRNTYAGAPFFHQYFPLAEGWLSATGSFSRLADFNVFWVKNLLELLGIATPCFRSSELPGDGKGPAGNISLVKALGGSTYLSGKGGGNYQAEADFSREGISLISSDFGGWLAENPYPQAQGGSFLGGLSVVDALFNVGEQGILQLFKSCPSSVQTL